MELAAAHMTLLRIAEEADKQQHRQTRCASESASGATVTAALITLHRPDLVHRAATKVSWLQLPAV